MTGKRSIFSVVAIALCFVLMLGATWALFQDSATNSNNLITTGSVVVAFTDAADNTIDGENGVFNCTGWTPGASAYKTFKVANNGTLALDWAVTVDALNETGDTYKLSQIVDVYYAEGEQNDTANMTKLGTLAEVIEDGVAEGTIAAEGAAATFTIALVLPDVEGINNYQALSSSFSIVLNAAEAQ